MKIAEKCSCGARFEIAVFPNSALERWDWRMEQIKDWRASHRHEMPEEPADQPMIHESGSSHERLGDEYPVLDRARPAGFRAND
ncbi:hypothetical protein [Microbacterium sp. zg-YB36]|uniref:hypothetical protein n=1 Tax=Microbacterium sp. zg-YB36 TaxID=2969407 RepID=UPI00214B3C2E|nr:hypothetical protein [Microbacterium sp. zg-YB36]MDL5351113.1 hypothetical protein [Microbacterium sp. zg-YB36]